MFDICLVNFPIKNKNLASRKCCSIIILLKTKVTFKGTYFYTLSCYVQFRRHWLHSNFMKINNLAEKAIKPLSNTMATFLNSQMYGNIYHLNIQTICTIIWLHFLTEMYIINVHIYEEANMHSKYFF